jgi:Gpi18-like mannosyltransferase
MFMLAKFKQSPMILLIIFVIVTKVVAFSYLYNLNYPEPYGRLTPDRWWLVFHRWDSAFYDRIASSGYVELKYWAFLPAFPAIITALSTLIGNSSDATVIGGLFFGMLWIPVYYITAAKYMSQRLALNSTLMFLFFPTVYLFTSLGYTEGLWLTTTIAGWYSYLRGKHLTSSIMLAVSTLTRVPGIILPAIISLRLLTQRRTKLALAYCLPLVFLIAWLGYGFFSTGELIAPLAAQEKTVWDPHFNFVELFLAKLVNGKPGTWGDHDVFVVLIISLFLYLSLKVFNVDKTLGVYSICLFVFYLFSANFLSLSRYLPCTFPIWLSVREKKKSITLVYVIFSFLLVLILWSQFLNDRWVG